MNIEELARISPLHPSLPPSSPLILALGTLTNFVPDPHQSNTRINLPIPCAYRNLHTGPWNADIDGRSPSGRGIAPNFPFGRHKHKYLQIIHPTPIMHRAQCTYIPKTTTSSLRRNITTQITGEPTSPTEDVLLRQSHVDGGRID